MAKKKRKRTSRKRRYSSRRFKLAVAFLSAATAALFALVVVLVYHTFRFSSIIDERLQGESLERPAWVYARTFELRRGQRLGRGDLIAVLNDLGYREVSTLGDEPGTFQVRENGLDLRRRGPFPAAIAVRFDALWVSELRLVSGGGPIERLPFEPVPVTTLFGEERAKKRWVPLEEMPPHVPAAVLATEDRRFFDHTGLDPVGITRALVSDIVRGDLSQGGSTLTQQLVKNYFLTPERTLKRKLLEAYLAIILETRASKDEILELYLNDVYLGQRGSFGIRGVGQASQIFFGKNVKNIELAEAALIAAIIRSPNAASPYRSAEDARARRDLVLEQMAEAGYVETTDVQKAKATPLGLETGTIDRGEAPYFIDALRLELGEFNLSGLSGRELRVVSTMDRYLQSAAQRAVADGLDEIAPRLAAESARDDAGQPQAALVALDPSSGDVLAIVGARSYGTSQFNRAIAARRQPGSAFKPFVYLAAFEHDDRLTPSTPVVDEPVSIRGWSPRNYTKRFYGPVSYRQALAQSLNVATARVGQEVGFERVVALWDAMGMSSRLEPYPSLVLGSFELTPLELATAYAVLANGGLRVEPRLFTSIETADGRPLHSVPVASRRAVSARSTRLVTDMLTDVVDSTLGTGREVRARGFDAQAAAKTGTTDDTRDAWFVGYTPDVLAVVWVGFDDNRPLGLTGSEAALPIWTRFMKAAVSGREKARFKS